MVLFFQRACTARAQGTTYQMKKYPPLHMTAVRLANLRIAALWQGMP